MKHFDVKDKLKLIGYRPGMWLYQYETLGPASTLANLLQAVYEPTSFSTPSKVEISIGSNEVNFTAFDCEMILDLDIPDDYENQNGIVSWLDYKLHDAITDKISSVIEFQKVISVICVCEQYNIDMTIGKNLYNQRFRNGFPDSLCIRTKMEKKYKPFFQSRFTVNPSLFNGSQPSEIQVINCLKLLHANRLIPKLEVTQFSKDNVAFFEAK